VRQLRCRGGWCAAENSPLGQDIQINHMFRINPIKYQFNLYYFINTDQFSVYSGF
jgi:hypothetical protein